MTSDDKTLVLVIDDEIMTRDIMGRYLDLIGKYEVCSAADGIEGLKLFHESRPEAVITDLHMPKMNGFDVLNEVKNTSPETPVIVVSGTDDIHDVIRALSLGAWEFITKPVHSLELVDQLLGKVLEKSQLMKDNTRYRRELEDEIHKRNEEIEERKKAEEALLIGKDRIRAFSESAPDAIFSVNQQGLIIYANKSSERIFGYSQAELINQPVQMLIPKDEYNHDKEKMTAFFIKNQSTKMSRIFQSTCVTKKGSLISVELSRSYWEHKDEKFVTVIIRDITERKELEIELANARRLESIGQLAAGIAHEINTPTQYVGDNTRFLQDAITGLLMVCRKADRILQTAKNGPVPPDLMADFEQTCGQADLDYLEDELPKAIEQTLEGVDRISGIVRAMKEFSHPGGKEKTLTDINKAIESTITVSRNEWKYVADLETDLDRNMPMVPVLPGDFNQVILNMIVNAAHAVTEALGENSSKKGLITIKTGFIDDWAEIRIIDNGCGIPEAIKNRIFDPFFTTKDVGKGTGQGLTIARTTIVEKHGGTITVNSDEKKGTEFTIRVPAHEEGVV